MADKQALADAQNSLRTFTVKCLGQGAEGANEFKKARANRFVVMDRLQKLGAGLSQAQRADFPWFKEAYDKAMFEQYDHLWPEQFMAMVQLIMDKIEQGTSNYFSMWVHSETKRLFSEENTIRI